MSTLRAQALSLFKSLNRTAQEVFRGDGKAFHAARAKIREEFAKNATVESENSILELVQHGKDCEKARNQASIGSQ